MTRKIFFLFLILLFASCGSEKITSLSSDASKAGASKIAAQSILSNMENGGYVQGELLVKFKSGIVAASSLKSHQTVGARVLKRYSIVPNLEHVKLPDGFSVKDAIIKYMNDPNVEYAEPNFIKHASAISTVTPDDTFFFTQQWALNNTGQFGGTSGADIKAPPAWAVTTGSRNIVIAVLDTGIDLTHKDLAANIWTNSGETSCTDGLDNDNNGFVDDCHGWDFSTCAHFDQKTGLCTTQKTRNSNPTDDLGHGTHISGIIGAVGNNNLGIAGVMWSVQLMPLKFLNADGEGLTTDEIDAVGYAVANGARIINASFTSSGFSNSEFAALSAASSSGVLVIAAAGNGGVDGVGDNNDQTPQYPASYSDPQHGGLPNIISVAATDENDSKAFFSNFGLNSVHVAAPGVHILSTVPAGLPASFCLGSPFVAYEFCDGTSMAAPHVSGLAGLLYSYYTNFTYLQVRGTILRYVDALPSLSGLVQTSGRINAYKALSSLSTPTDLASTALAPGRTTLSWTDNASGEDGYKVEKKTGGGSFGEIATLPADSTAYTDNLPLDGTYRIRAFNFLPNPPGTTLLEADSVYSNETTAVNPPTNLTATATSASTINLAWADNSRMEDGFKIERKGQSDAVFSEIATVGPDVTTFTDSGLNPSTNYRYRVRAFNSAVAVNSLYSNEASATTFALTSGGGGGCSIGGRQNAPAAAADLAVMLMPLLVMTLLRRKRR